jgi:pilus assembly protein CpaB
MNTSRIIILGVAVAAAGGAGYIAKRMSAQPPAQIVVAASPEKPAVQLDQVLVLRRDLPMGEAIDNHLAWQSWPAEAISDGFITRKAEPDALEKMKGQVARMTMYTGEPMRHAKLADGQSFMSSLLPAGRRAVATQIAASTSAGGFILPNDMVDVIMTRRSQTGGAAEGYVTETILKNIRVLAIDQTYREDEEGRRVKVGETATLELTPEQAEIITVAQQLADRLALALRSVKDAQEVADSQADYLVSSSGRRGTVRLIKSGEVSEVGAR